mmetsp:Transcript_13159/g.15315  ORF Transcript_13159/g.15315 Transcript_13159/m.15315 type:complete len:340 (+) Transcript_13159:105-1124(+)
MEQYSEELNTISLYPQELYAEDLTPECGEEIDNICEEIHKACKGWGTSEKRLIEAIGNTTEYDRKLLSLRFEKTFGKDLKKYMKSECGNNGFGQALQYLSLGPVETECRMLKKAVDGLGSNKVMLYSILCGRSNEDMELLKKTYYKLYTDDLVSRMSGEVGGDMKKILLSAVQAAEEEFDPDYHTEDKAKEDAEIIYEAGQGRWGTNEAKMAKIVVLSPPKYLKLLNSIYADIYGYTLFKAFEEEMGSIAGEASLFTLGMKLKPYETIAKLIKKACAGFGTDELLLTNCIIRYQDLMPHVCVVHEDLYEKSVHTRVKDETRGDYEKLLLTLLNKVAPEE